MSGLMHLILRNLARNRLRTSLTVLAMMVLAMIHTFARTVVSAFDEIVVAHSSHTRLAVRERWIMPSQFPLSYVGRIAKLAGVEDWTIWHLVFGSVDSAGHQASGFATRLVNLVRMHPGLEGLDRAALDALRRDKTGALVSPMLIKLMNWRVGQRFTVASTVPAGKLLSFRIVGILPTDTLGQSFFFRDDYYQDATGDRELVSIMWLHVPDETEAGRLGALIERAFATSSPQLRVETEAASSSRFTGRLRGMVSIVQIITAVLLTSMAVILSNSISMMVRERLKETALLKVLGFPPGIVMALVVSEAVILGAGAGLLGAALAWAVSASSAAGLWPIRVDYIAMFPVGLSAVGRGLLLGGGDLPGGQWHSRLDEQPDPGGRRVFPHALAV